MVPSGKGHRCGGSVNNAVICTEMEVNHCGVYFDMPYIRAVYWGVADSGFQSKPDVLRAGPPLGAGSKRSQRRGRGWGRVMGPYFPGEN